MSFIFGEGTPWTYEQVQRQRQIADQLRGQNSDTPGSVGEGLAAVGRALSARMRERAADKRMGELGTQAQQYAEGGGELSPIQIKILQQLGIPGYAGGTGFHPGGMAMVGEKGPELLNLPRGAQVIPAQQTDGGLSEFMKGIIDKHDPSVFFQMPYRDVHGAMQWQDQIDPSIEREYDGLSPEDRAKVIDKIIRDPSLPMNDAIRPDGYDPHEMLQQDGALQGGAGQDVMMGQAAGDDLKLTEGQSKDVNWYRRGMSAVQALETPGMEEALTQYTDSFAGNFGALGRTFQDENFQVADRAAKEFLAIVLRKDTGAAVTHEEFSMYGPMYLPMPGDKPAVIAAKREARRNTINALRGGLGTATPIADRIDQELKPKESDEDFLKRLGIE
jgi:hypothetical protein